MKTKTKNIFKIALDVLMALIFAVIYNKKAFGGLEFHEIAGLAVAAFLIVHMILNRAWLKAVTKKLFNRKLPARTRFAYVVDALLLIAVAVIIVTGIMISEVLFPNLLSAQANAVLLHKTAAYFALLLIGVHLGLSWNRVMAIVKKLLHIRKNRAFGAVATVCAAAVFVFGAYNITATGYFEKLAAVTSGYSEGNGADDHFYDDGATSSGLQATAAAAYVYDETSGTAADAVSSASLKTVNSTDGDISLYGGGNGKGLHDGSGGGNGEGGGQGTDELTTIYRNLSIMAAFAVLTYYIDKLIHRKPKKRGVPARA